MSRILVAIALALASLAGCTKAMPAASYTHRTDFTATAATWTLADPETFLSSETAYYRCVPVP